MFLINPHQCKKRSSLCWHPMPTTPVTHLLVHSSLARVYYCWNWQRAWDWCWLLRQMRHRHHWLHYFLLLLVVEPITLPFDLPLFVQVHAFAWWQASIGELSITITNHIDHSTPIKINSNLLRASRAFWAWSLKMLYKSGVIINAFPIAKGHTWPRICAVEIVIEIAWDSYAACHSNERMQEDGLEK